MENRYYIGGQRGEVEGPYEAAAIRARLAAGEIHGNTHTCPEGEQSWRPLSSFADLMPASGAARTSLVGPILVTAFCCLVGGIVSIVYAASANSAAAAGNVTAALAARQKARTWMWIGFGVGLVVQGAYAALVVVRALTHP